MARQNWRYRCKVDEDALRKGDRPAAGSCWKEYFDTNDPNKEPIKTDMIRFEVNPHTSNIMNVTDIAVTNKEEEQQLRSFAQNKFGIQVQRKE